jgi:hypothetical protein
MGNEGGKLRFGLKEGTIERIKGVLSGHPEVRQVIMARVPRGITAMVLTLI